MQLLLVISRNLWLYFLPLPRYSNL